MPARPIGCSAIGAPPATSACRRWTEWPATTNVLVDELEVDADGNFEAILSADEHDGNWLKLAGDHPTLTVRNFLYDWDTEELATLQIERVGDEVEPTDRSVALDVSVARQLYALGEFVYDNLKFFLDFGAMPQANDFVPPMDMSSMGAAAENRPVIGRFELEPDEALVLEFEPPKGVYWSISLGNPWLETIHYGRHQSSLNGHQAVVDPDGLVRFVLAAAILAWRTGSTPPGTATARCSCVVCEPKPLRCRAPAS